MLTEVRGWKPLKRVGPTKLVSRRVSEKLELPRARIMATSLLATVSRKRRVERWPEMRREGVESGRKSEFVILSVVTFLMIGREPSRKVEPLMNTDPRVLKRMDEPWLSTRLCNVTSGEISVATMLRFRPSTARLLEVMNSVPSKSSSPLIV